MSFWSTYWLTSLSATCEAAPTQPKYPTIAQDALDWCLNEAQGVPLWQPDPDEDFKTTGKGIVRVADAREFDPKKNQVTKARVAAMAVWAKVSASSPFLAVLS